MLGVGLVLGIATVWAWNAFLWVFFVKPGDGGIHLHRAGRTVAGSANAQTGFFDGKGPDARMAKPIRLAQLDARTVVFADINNHAIRTVDLDGNVRTLAGGPTKVGHQDGPADQARFKSPHGVAVRADGVIAVGEVGNDAVRLMVPKAGGGYDVKTVVGGPGRKGFQDGAASEARLSSPHAVLWGPSGELYIADIGNARVRCLRDGQISTVAGTGKRGLSDGPQGQISWPMDLALGSDGTLWIADCGTLTLRTWRADRGLGTPFPGLRLAMPHGVAVREGQVLVAEMNGQRVLAYDIKDARVSTLYGDGAKGFGPGQLNRPAALLLDGSRLWVADLYNHRVVLVELPN